VKRLYEQDMTPDQRGRFNDLKRLITHIVNTYGLWWMLEATIAQLKESIPERLPYAVRLIDNLNKTTDDYQARYDEEDKP
jgi:hypothetical protein